MIVRILVAVQPPSLHARVRRLLSQSDDVLVTFVESATELVDRLPRENCDIALLGGQVEGGQLESLIPSIRSGGERSDVVVLTGNADPVEQARIFGLGCLAVLPVDLPDAILARSFETVIQRRRRQTIAALRTGPRSELPDDAAESASPAMQELHQVVERVVRADSSLLILGETGVGKEWLARSVHRRSHRASGPFLAVNCGALPETLLESELFGHEEGAFTGAARARRGYFELAHGGTIFLDEIGDMPLHLQVKLLRVLQDHAIVRVGSETSIDIDVRVMAATNRELLAEVESRRFRSDLYYRLGVVTLTVPPLRERREDIADLCRRFIHHFRLKLGNPVRGVTQEALRVLQQYAWPGNVRELANVVERAVLLSNDAWIGLDDLPEAIFAAGEPSAAGAGRGAVGRDDGLLALPLYEARDRVIADFEAAYLDGLLRRTRGRVGEAARIAGIAPRSLYNKMRALGLRKDDYRA